MHEEDLEVAIKVVVVGNGAVGKSSMIQRYCKGVFTKDYKKTIGVDFLEKQTRVGKDDVRLMVWDTAGQEEFDAITKAYYRGAQVCVLAFSTVDRDSFLAIESWKKKVEDEVCDIVMTIVQNKIDLIDEAVMTTDEVDALAKRLKLKLFRVSVKEGFNVEQVFDYLAVKYLDRRRRLEEESKPKTTSIGVLSSESSGNSVASSNSGPIQSSTSGSGGESFQIKPSKQRAKKKTTLCSLL